MCSTYIYDVYIYCNNLPVSRVILIKITYIQKKFDGILLKREIRKYMLNILLLKIKLFVQTI